MLRKILGLVITTLIALNLSAQVSQGGLKGKVTDAATGEPLPFVNVVLEKDGSQHSGGSTDIEGTYFLKPLPPGEYDLKVSFVGYKPKQINGVEINSDKISFQDVSLESTVEEIEEFEVVEYTVPLIDKDNTTGGGTISKEDIQRMPGRSGASIANTVGGVFSSDDGSGDQYIRGARSDANYYFIDGMKVRGSNTLPQSAIEQVSVLMGGLPAQYGDVTGGVVSITTRGPSRDFSGGMEYITSGYKIGEDVVGFDDFGYNLLELSATGPLVMKKDEEGNKTEPLLGFFISGNGRSLIDPRPTGSGLWQVKPEVLASLKEDPLRISPTGVGVFQNAEFLRLDDFNKIATTPNAANNSINLNGKIDVNTGPKTNLTFGGTFNYSKNRIRSFANTPYNSENNGEAVDYTWRAYGRFTQRFYSDKGDENSKASTIKNAYYSLQVDYTEDVSRRYDPDHQDQLFKYGHYGQFQRFTTKDYNYAELGLDTATGRLGYRQTTFVDTLVGYRPGDSNPVIADIIQDYYETYGWEGYDDNGNPVFNAELADDPTTADPHDFLRNLVELQNKGGLRNGDPMDPVYGLWNAVGTPYNNFTNVKNNQLRFTAQGSADLGDHAILIGFEYEQRADRAYDVNPTSLWLAGRQYVNNHIENLDYSDPDIDYYQGQERFTYSRLNPSPGAYDASREGENQSFFDYNVRQHLGLNTDGTDDIDFDNLTPEDLDISYFSADELLSFSLPRNDITYYGYNHAGDRYDTEPTFEDYFTARDEHGNLTRPVGAFRPIYMAGYIQDKFSFDDLVFNVGLRVDRFDANQPVLKDPFVFFPTVKAGEDEAMALTENGHPQNIGEDYVVYVDDVRDPTGIVGYRSETTWYNAEGIEVDNPQTLETSSGIAPLLVDKTKSSTLGMGPEAFEDYTPQNMFMPRISFSFPISDEALFFAHYDILTKRPTDGLRLNPHQYVYLESLAGGPILNNPNLKPEQTIDYELGFQQKLTRSSSFKLSAFYREMRDQVQLINRSQAYPIEYRTYDNIDFGTVKGMTFTYDLRRTGNIWIKASYTLQFAEGTGSDPQTARSLIVAGKDNLRTTNPLDYDQRHTLVVTTDYRFAGGKNYNGPVINNKQILKNTGANFVINAGSGTPYSAQGNATATQLPGGANAILDGTINGARLPWQLRVDARIDRDIQLKLGENKERYSMNVYFQILNLFNTLNVNNVYRYTGDPKDDGYLTAPVYSADIASQISTQSFIEQYTMRVNNPYNYSLPRRIRLGVILNF